MFNVDDKNEKKKEFFGIYLFKCPAPKSRSLLFVKNQSYFSIQTKFVNLKRLKHRKS